MAGRLNVAVLGCGPAGLMAAHGASCAMRDLNVNVDALVRVFSRKRKSRLFGAQYLHKPIREVTPLESVHVNYELRGTAEQYREKVYGMMWDGTVSPEDLAERHLAWDIRKTYDRLWELYEGMIIDTGHITFANLHEIDQGGWDIIINTIPRDRLCYRGHVFGSTEVIAAGDAPELGIDVSATFRCEPDTVICNGEDYPSWYRMSNIFGHTTVEWPKNMRTAPPVLSAQVVQKPTYTDCSCWPGWNHTGRYGSWEKGKLSHEAYDDAYALTHEGLRRATAQAAQGA